MKKLTKKKGLTLIEIIAALLIFSIVIVLIGNVVKVSFFSLPQTKRSTAEQNTIRMVGEKLTGCIQDATDIITVPQGEALSSFLKDGWNYYGLSDDKSQIIHSTYDKATNSYKHFAIADFDAKVDGNLAVKQNAGDKALIDFELQVIPKSASNGDGTTLMATAKAESATVILDYGTTAAPAKGILYRKDKASYGKVVGNVMLLVDISGSMNNNMAGDPTNNIAERRITKLQNALLGGEKDGQYVEGFVDSLAKLHGIEFCLIPFNRTANYMGNNGAELHPYKTLDDAAEKQAVKTEIEQMSDYVGDRTNTGDALRRAYHCNDWIKDKFKTMPEYSGATKTKDIAIVFLDGEADVRSVKEKDVVIGSVDRELRRDGQVDNQYVEYIINGHQEEGIVYTDYYKGIQYAETRAGYMRTKDVKFYYVGIGDSTNSNVATGVYDIDLFMIELMRNSTSSAANMPNSYRIRDNDSFSDVLSMIKDDIERELLIERGPKF